MKKYLPVLFLVSIVGCGHAAKIDSSGGPDASLQNDLALTQEVRVKIVFNGTEPDAMKIRVSVINGVVTLSGLVRSDFERTKLERAARSVKGVTAVVDHLMVDTTKAGKSNH